MHAHNIKYEYEKPAKDSFNRRISRPDFYLPEYDVYVEYWGMVDAEDKAHEERVRQGDGVENGALPRKRA